MNSLSGVWSAMTVSLAQATPPAQPNLFATLLPLLLIVLVMYFLMIRPQQRKQKAHQAMISSLKTGDEVVTAGGIYGSVVGVDDKKSIVYLKIANDVKIKVERFAVTRVVQETGEISPK
jgi:preprotein translocase subunit YajC